MITLVAPRFWYAHRVSLQSLVLLPLALIWQAASRLRAVLAKPYAASMPVICIGNVLTGGTGKTPACIAVLRAYGAKNPCFLTRGYRGAAQGPVLVREADARAHGDEAVLLSRHAPVIVARDRAAGLALAEKEGFDLVIADDGFQNPHFKKTASVLVFDGSVGTGNGACIPAGPLREPLCHALARANAAIIVGSDATQLRARLTVPVFTAGFETTARGEGPYVAFAGIGRPQKFFDTLSQNGYMLAETVSFPDHHAYSPDDIARLRALAARHGARLITTEKDMVRLTDAHGIEALPVTLSIAGSGDLIRILRRA